MHSDRYVVLICVVFPVLYYIWVLCLLSNSIRFLKTTCHCHVILWFEPRLRSQSRKESEVFGWSQICNNTSSWSWKFCLTLEVQLNYFLHHTPELRIPVEMVQFLMKLLLKQIIVAMYHDFHWVLVATKFLTAKLHSFMLRSCSQESQSKTLERLKLESDILPPTLQPWFKLNFFAVDV